MWNSALTVKVFFLIICFADAVKEKKNSEPGLNFSTSDLTMARFEWNQLALLLAGPCLLLVWVNLKTTPRCTQVELFGGRVLQPIKRWKRWGERPRRLGHGVVKLQLLCVAQRRLTLSSSVSIRSGVRIWVRQGTEKTSAQGPRPDSFTMVKKRKDAQVPKRKQNEQWNACQKPCTVHGINVV